MFRLKSQAGQSVNKFARFASILAPEFVRSLLYLSLESATSPLSSPPMPSRPVFSHSPHESSSEATQKAPQAPSQTRVARSSAAFTMRKHWIGWQGFTFTLPSDWNLASFGGEALKGNLRVDDGDGPRIELRWETPNNTVDLEKSIADLVNRLAREAKKKKRAFNPASHPAIVNKHQKPKAQLVNFGWASDDSEPLAAHGWGTAWHCSHCGRVAVAHLLGRANEKPRTAQQLASDIFTSMECHGQGGWQAWSVFGLSGEIPLDFTLARAKLQTGRLEIEWERPIPIGPRGWWARAERIILRRSSAANLLLENETLEDWTRRTMLWLDKKSYWEPSLEWAFQGNEGLSIPGSPKPFKQRIAHAVRQKLRANVPQLNLHVWHDEETNKILSLETELLPSNAHVLQDVLDSLEYI